MLKIATQDLIIRLDEQRGVLQFLAPKKGGKAEELRICYEWTANDIPKTESWNVILVRWFLPFFRWPRLRSRFILTSTGKRLKASVNPCPTRLPNYWRAATLIVSSKA